MIYNSLNAIINLCLLKGVSPKTREALGMITEDMVDRPDYRSTIKAIKELDNFGSTVDMLSVGDHLGSKVEFSFLAELSKNSVPSMDPIRDAMQVVSCHNDRLATIEMQKALSVLGSGKPFDREGLCESISKLSELIAPTSQSKPKSFAEFASGYADTLEYRQENPGSYGLDIGLDVLIEHTALVVLGGQPGMGKTALALYVNDFVASQNKKSLIFSLEMDGGQLFERQVSAKSKVSSKKLKAIGDEGLTNDDWARLSASICQLSEMNIYIDDEPNLSVPMFMKKCRDFKEQHPDLALITVDYLTLMKMPDAPRRDLAVGEATRLMKLLAKEIKTPVLLLSQLNREADKAAREPRPSDLRDSGSIEQDADVIIFPYREEVHIPDSPNKGLAKIIKAKVREGEVGDYCLGFTQGSFHEVNASWREKEPEQEPIRKKF